MAYLRKRYLDFLYGVPSRHFPGGQGISAGLLSAGAAATGLGFLVFFTDFTVFTFSPVSFFYKKGSSFIAGSFSKNL